MTTAVSKMNNQYQFLEQISGYKNRKNDLIVFPNSCQVSSIIYYFGGDIQDLPERMNLSREYRQYQQWNLVTTGEILSKKFKDSSIVVIRANEMKDGTFSRFSSFLPNTTEYGDPITYDTTDFTGLHQLHTFDQQISKSSPNITLIGFSKGCVVLNQLLHELTAFRTIKIDNELTDFISRIHRFIWLDGGHNNGDRTMIWPTDENLISTLEHFQIQTEIYVTPFQINSKNPYKKNHTEQYKKFLELLTSSSDCNNRVINRMHFKDDKPSIEKHFELLTTF
ncbi:hypothetical protein I4U23_026076 [Adineta vaga]|nr:hypothetical protein I4U23_026076 [Adineta vaga]